MANIQLNASTTPSQIGSPYCSQVALIPSIRPVQICFTRFSAGINTLLTASVTIPHVHTKKSVNICSFALIASPVMGANASEKAFATLGAKSVSR